MLCFTRVVSFRTRVVSCCTCVVSCCTRVVLCCTRFISCCVVLCLCYVVSLLVQFSRLDPKKKYGFFCKIYLWWYQCFLIVLQWIKRVNIIPVLKKKSKLSKENYRPTGILPNISKVNKRQKQSPEVFWGLRPATLLK